MVKKYFKHLVLSVISSFLSFLIYAQSSADSTAGMDNVMRSHDKIYVVMAVCVTILVILFLYLIRIDLKVSKKEKIV